MANDKTAQTPNTTTRKDRSELDKFRVYYEFVSFSDTKK